MEFTKDLRRGERRWRSYTKFMRRLRRDWNEHRWNWNPRKYPRYGLTPQGACSIWADTDLCPCFYDPGMAGWARFKDTPHRSCSGYECDPRRATHGVASRTIQEWRSEEVVRENYHVRNRRDGIRLVKQTCIRCGFLIKKRWVRFGDFISHWNDECPACAERMKRKTSYWRGNQLLEFDKKPA